MNMTAVAIVGMICWAIVRLNAQSRRDKNLGKNESDLKLQLSELQERVATLEKIVTDEKYDLNKQFEDLKKQ